MKVVDRFTFLTKLQEYLRSPNQSVQRDLPLLIRGYYSKPIQEKLREDSALDGIRADLKLEGHFNLSYESSPQNVFYIFTGENNQLWIPVKANNLERNIKLWGNPKNPYIGITPSAGFKEVTLHFW